MKGYVHYGCAMSAPATWRNFDSSPTPRLQRIPVLGLLFHGGKFPDFPKNIEYGDIVKGLPVQPNSCQAVYCSHVLEHLALNDFYIALRNTYKYLRKDGVFRLVVPDLEFLARTYVNNPEPDASLTFMRRSHLGFEKRPRKPNELLRAWFGSRHLWMWDEKSLRMELERAGFRNIRRAAFNDAADPRFKDVEDPGRWGNHLGMECIK